MLYSNEHINFLKKKKKKKFLIAITQILIFITFIIIWELLAKYKIINTFLTSSPSLIFKTIINLAKDNNLFNHILVTLYETLISFTLSIIIGIIIASILWWNNFLSKVLDTISYYFKQFTKSCTRPYTNHMDRCKCKINYIYGTSNSHNNQYYNYFKRF